MPARPAIPRAQAETREAILTAARDLLLEVGHDKLSLRGVARRASFSPAGLYEYFDSKEALLRAVADRGEARLRAALLSALANPHPTSRRAIRAVLLAYIAFARENAEDFRLLFSMRREERRSMADPIKPGGPWEILVACVERAVAAGELALPEGFPVEGAAYVLWAQAHGAAALQTTYLEAVEAPFEIGDLYGISSLLRGMSSPPPATPSA